MTVHRHPLRFLVLTGLLAAAALCAGAAVGAAESPVRIGGVTFEAHATLAGRELQLNGAGLRAVAWIKGYAAALYLGERSSDPDQVVAQPGPKRLQLRMLLDVPVEEFIKAFHKGVQRNTPASEFARLTERMARFDAMMQPVGEVKKGDLVNLDFLPGQGLLFSYNGRLLGPAIAGEDLYGGLLRCFIGERPVDQKLKAGLLGKPI